MYALTQLVTDATNFTIHGESLIDVILTNDSEQSLKAGSVNVGLSDSHNLVYTIIRSGVPRLPARMVTYRCYKNFDMDKYEREVANIPASACEVFDDPSDNYWVLQSLLTEVINDHAPVKTTKVRARVPPFLNKEQRAKSGIKQVSLISTKGFPRTEVGTFTTDRETRRH